MVMVNDQNQYLGCQYDKFLHYLYFLYASLLELISLFDYHTIRSLRDQIVN